MDYTQEQLDRLMDKTKMQTFSTKNAAFFGSLLCSMDIRFDPKLEYDACTDCATHITFNPDRFYTASENTREILLIHELNHVGRLHMIRRGNRDPKNWNIACDIRIDTDMAEDGYKMPPDYFVMPEIDKNGKLSEEQIYDMIQAGKLKPPPNADGDLAGGSGDTQAPPTPDETKLALEAVARAVSAEKTYGQAGKQAGSVSGTMEEFLSNFTKPRVPWELKLRNFFTDLDEEDVTWSRPNRRFRHLGMYLPSTEKVGSKLEHLMYFLDVSSSVTDADLRIFNGEVKYIQDVLKPKKLTLVQFDTAIKNVRVLEENDDFNGITIHGRGGTCLVCVRDYIQKHKPTAAVIFSDMQVRPMEPLSIPIPVLWVAINNTRCSVRFGELIHLDSSHDT